VIAASHGGHTDTSRNYEYARWDPVEELAAGPAPVSRGTVPSMRNSIFAAVLCVGCSVQTSVPTEAEIQCTRDAECPGARICALEVGLCIKPGADLVAPGLEGVSVTPDLARRDSVVTIGFSVDEPLGVEPSVHLQCDDQLIDDLVAAPVDGLTYTFTYTPDDDTPEGVPCDLTLGVVDEAGNSATQELPRVVIFDFTAPSVLDFRVTLVPTTDNPLSTVTAATVGTTIEVELLLDDEVTELASVSALLASELAFVRIRSIGMLHTYEAVVASDTPEGTLDLQFDGADPAGNTVQAAIGQVVVDRTRPLEPAVDVADTIVLRRAPWDTLGTPAHAEIEGVAGAVEGDTLVEIRASAASGSMPLDEVSADTFGAFGPTDLPISIGPQVFVRAIDGAGNVSDERGTRDGTWLASAQQATQYPAVEVALATTSGVELEPAALGTSVNSSVLASAEGDRDGSVWATGRRTWRQRLHGQSNLPRAAAAVAYDSRRNRTWIFGGHTSYVGAALQDMWSWNGHDWEYVAQQGDTPGPRFGARMVYDLRRDRLVLFGGAVGAESIDPGQTSDELWEFDGTSWAQVPSSGDWPSARTRHAMAYDYDRGVTVLFGGCSDGFYSRCVTTQLADTWEWDGSTWQQVHDGVTGEFPSPRSAAAMVYAPIVGGSVLTGGCLESATQHFGRCQEQVGDTWIWDGASWQSSTASSWRAYHNLVFNSADQTVMLIGGCRSVTGGDNDCENQLSLYPQTWDGVSSWSVYENNGNAPLRNFDGIATYDAARSEVMLSMGYYGSGSQWSKTAITRGPDDHRLVHNASSNRPTARQGARAAYDSGALDSGTPQIVFYGGQLNALNHDHSDNELSDFSDELWRLADGQWQGPSTAGTPRARASVAVDESRRHLVIVGGHDDASALGDTIEADLTRSNPGGWVACDATGLDGGGVACWPGWGSFALWSAPAVYDPLATPNPVVRVFGGFDSNPNSSVGSVTARDSVDDWDGTLWADAGSVPVVSSSPLRLRRAAAGVAYDSLRDVVVLYGGLLDHGRGGDDPYSRAQDTWEWNRGTGLWTLVCDPVSCPNPGRRSYFGFVYDSVRARVLLFGGLAVGGGRANDVWEWDGNAWNQMSVSGVGPAGRDDAAVAYDPGNARLVVFGGRTGAGLEDDLWQLDLGETYPWLR